MQTISIDIDGVIANSLFSKFHKKIIDYYLNFKRNPKESYSVIEKEVHKFIYSHPTKIIPKADEAINLLNKNSYKVILNSARPGFLEGATYNWLRKNKLFELVHHISLRNNGLDPIKSKIDTIKKHKIKIHIDDNPDIVNAISKIDTIEKIFFINNGNDKNNMDSILNNPKIIISDSLHDAVQKIIKK